MLVCYRFMLMASCLDLENAGLHRGFDVADMPIGPNDLHGVNRHKMFS